MATYYVDHAAGSDSNDGSSPAQAFQTLGKALDTVAAGDHVYVKGSEDYVEEHGTSGACGEIVTAGSVTAPIVIDGYADSPGDAGQAVIDGTTNGLVKGIATAVGAANYYVFKNLTVKNCSGTGFGIGTAGDSVTFKNCVSDNNGSGFQGDNSIAFENCTASNNAGFGFDCDDGCLFVGCRAFTNAGDGISCNYGVLFACEVFDNAGGGETAQVRLQTATLNAVIGCTIDGEAASAASTIIGVKLDSASTLLQAVLNTVVHDCDVGISADTASGELQVSRNNLLNASAVADRENWIEGAEELTDPSGGPGFTDEGNRDYSLTSSSAAKAAGYDAGTAAAGASYADIGAHQRQEPAGGGPGRVVLIG